MTEKQESLYTGLSCLAGIVTFAGIWIYSMGEWGLLWGLMFGWIPGLIGGVLGGIVWPLAVVVILWALFANF